MSQKYKKPKIYRPEPVQYDDGIETNIYGIAEQICSRPAQPPNSIHLIMDHEVPIESDLDEFEFELVKNFFMACLKIFYGPNCNPLELNEKDLDKLKEYIYSIGYALITDIEECEQSHKFTIKFKRYQEYMGNIQNSKLDHLSII